jgi:hypothetical protein
MRILGFASAILCAGPLVLAAQAPNLIEWSSERRLRREDFQGRPPVAAAIASTSRIHIDTSWECNNGRLIASARATFDSSQSWWRAGQANIWGDLDGVRDASRAQLEARRSAGQRDAQLLAHEQLHFDLAEVAARKIRARFVEFKNACAAAGGTEPIQRMVADIDQELQEEQVRYDRETAHGVNAPAQDQWAQRVRKLLQ